MPKPATLADLLCPGLEVVFVGINPSLYSVAAGHYFARRINRFWPCFSRSILSEGVRRALGLEMLTPAQDRAMPEQGFGFTDLVKRPTARAAELMPDELVAGTLASYLLGDSVLQFSTIIGTYLFAMGLGSAASRYLKGSLVGWFVQIELLVGVVGG